MKAVVKPQQTRSRFLHMKSGSWLNYALQCDGSTFGGAAPELKR
ncbi:MAG: hypothetical protein RIQ71_1847 [Verrucomicrobiota bacterium]|jgi:hypothetical protein